MKGLYFQELPKYSNWRLIVGFFSTCGHKCTVSSENLKADPRVEDIKLIQGSLCQKEAVEEEEDEDGEGENGSEDDSEAGNRESEVEDEKILPSVQNKFSLLAGDE